MQAITKLHEPLQNMRNILRQRQRLKMQDPRGLPSNSRVKCRRALPAAAQTTGGAVGTGAFLGGSDGTSPTTGTGAAGGDGSSAGISGAGGASSATAAAAPAGQHNARFALDAADRVYVLNDGKVVHSGPARELARDEQRLRALAGAGGH